MTPSNHENDFPPHPIPLPPGEREIYRGINLNPLPLGWGRVRVGVKLSIFYVIYGP